MYGSLLIVDDEVYAVEGLQAAVDWTELGFASVFVAFSAAQAREITLANDVALVLCDIEMPEETGLDFLAWIKGQKPGVEVIFLTAHADFSLAQQAIRLQGFDYLVKPVAPDDLRKVVIRALRKALPESTPPPRQVPLPEDLDPQPLRLPETGPWAIWLKSGAKEKVRFEVRSQVDRIRNHFHNRVPAPLWNRLLLDYQQMLASVLKSRSIPAHELLSADGAADLLRRAPESGADLSRWVDYSLDFVADRLEQRDRSQSPVGEALAYIRQNLDTNLSCELVAQHVAMNPDYLTRLFKKEVGLSVSSVIAREKMALAAQLLATTALPISEIGARVGYENHAHFSTAFKKERGTTPSEFRSVQTESQQKRKAVMG